MGAVLLIAAGIPTSYREFIVLGAVALGAVVLALVLPRCASQLTLHRVLSRPMVQRGDQLSLRLRITPAHSLPPTRFIDRARRTRRGHRGTVDRTRGDTCDQLPGHDDLAWVFRVG